MEGIDRGIDGVRVDLLTRSSMTRSPPWWMRLILSLAAGLFRPPLRVTVLSALDMSDYPWLWRLFPAVSFFINRLLGGNLRFQTLAEPFAIYADVPITPCSKNSIAVPSSATARGRWPL